MNAQRYLFSIIALILILPLISIFLTDSYTVDGMVKWFIFWAVGVRLFSAGLMQCINPSVTAELLEIKEDSSYKVIRELGVANISFGIVGILSLFIPSWRLFSAFISGVFYLLVGINHIQKGIGPKEKIALYSDLAVSMLLWGYVLYNFL